MSSRLPDSGRAHLSVTATAIPDLPHFDPVEFNAAVSAVTNAFGDPTRREIYLLIRDARTGMTAGEIAERFKLHSNVARHHLEKLATAGYVIVDTARPNDQDTRSAGRPSKRYRVSEAATNIANPPGRDDLIGTLLARALDLLPPEQAEVMAGEVGYAYGHELASRMAPAEHQRSVKEAVATVAEALTAHGFAAHAEARGSEMTIVADSCPFGIAAQQYPHVICAVDHGMIRGLMAGLYGETASTQEARRTSGDDTCVTLLG